MGIIEVMLGGSTAKTERFLKNMEEQRLFDSLEVFGQEGVNALESATPRDTGLAASSWYYKITRSAGGATISWYNTDVDDQGTPIVILLQYGHGTGTGGYVKGIDFINPVMDDVFNDAIEAVWKAVQS